MNGGGEFLLGALMVVGLVGIIVPVLPGLVVIGGVAVFWAFEVGTWQAWAVVALMVLIMGTGTFVKYQIPGRELSKSQVSARTWVLATVAAVVGFFVVPVVGLALGFVLGVYVGERLDRGSHDPAWASTRRLLTGIGKGMAVEFVAGASAILVWAIAAFTL